ncbi:MAG: hypothetical protein KIT84_19140 [Labilithrix sp.]|nr:hypothetical protein [Labilithrix sp.]MCW5813151.1 hypothetical protein [Labilithrix sp.]
MRTSRAFLVVAAISCGGSRPPPEPQSIRVGAATGASIPAPPPAAPPCDPLLATTLQRITKSPYAFDREPFRPTVPELGLQGEVIDGFTYTTHDAVLTDAKGRATRAEVFALVVTRWDGATTTTAEEKLQLENTIELQKRHPKIALPGGRTAGMVHLPGVIFVDMPRADGKTWLRLMWFGIPREAKEPPELTAWLEPYTADFYGPTGGPGAAVEWRRVVSELDACVPR